MKTNLLPLFICLSIGTIPLVQAAAALHVLRNEHGTALLQNGDFEQFDSQKLVAWRAAPGGFKVVEHAGRSGSHALLCESDKSGGWFGASQTLVFNRPQTVPLIVRGWSKAEDVSGGSDSDYSLYVDLVYTDGTPLWGQTASFRAGTHDWQERQFEILPEKPVRSLTFHCLFRGRKGRAWFDDVSVEALPAGNGAWRFQGVAVQPTEEKSTAVSAGQGGGVASGDKLSLSFDGNFITESHVGARALAGGQPSGFLARDVAANSDFFGFTNGACAEIGLQLETHWESALNHLAVSGRLSDTTHRDRAVTLVFMLPVPGTGWTWGDDIRRQRPITGPDEYANVISVHCGATGSQSLYPVAPIWDKTTGLALGLDMARPAVYRLGYHAGLHRLFLAFDFGLSEATAAFPSAAHFRFVLFQFDPTEGFRAAWQKYMQIFPDAFAVRSTEQGLWMPFTDVSKVSGWEDFGFRYHEGNNNVPWDDAHGVLSFRYTEPMTWWMPMAKDVPRTLTAALQTRDQLIEDGRRQQKEMAVISRLAAMHDETGEPALLFRDTPWANGAVWSLNPNPWLGVASVPDATSADPSPAAPAITNAATIYWNPQIRDRLYGPNAHGHLDGEYLDSLEGYVTAELNFRRDHFRTTTVPLTFSSETKQLALFKGLAVYEFTRWLAQDVHRLGKLMFANGVPYRLTYLCPSLDVLGTETDWLQNGHYHPASLSTMDLWRTMSGAKPYLLLMNTDYDQFTPDRVELYFQRSLFYGMWPGFFSHNAADNPYWQNPRWYERDRPLFKKYLPLIRQVAQAGWQPVAHAKCSNPKLLVERFGPDAAGHLYFTLFNDTPTAQSGMVRIDTDALHQGGRTPLRLLGPEMEAAESGFKLSLDPGQAALWSY